MYPLMEDENITYEEEDTCHMRRRIHARQTALMEDENVTYEEEDTCHMRRRIHARQTALMEDENVTYIFKCYII